MIRKIFYGIAIIIFSYFAVKWITKQFNTEKKPPYEIGTQVAKITEQQIKIPYREMDGVKVIPVKLNGVSMDMIYDPGCSGISISTLELITLYKNNQIDDTDFIGFTYAQIADGSIVPNAVIQLRDIQIGEGNNAIKLHNKTASVTDNIGAPVLLGNEVFDDMKKIEIDNTSRTINFTKK